MYLLIQGLLIARAVPLTDAVQQRHAVRLQAAGNRVEEGAVVEDADMLEHADRDDPVEAAIQRAR